MGCNQGGMTVVSFDRAAFNQGGGAKYNMGIDENDCAFTVVAKGPGGVCYDEKNKTDEKIIVRRLTPTEFARLQGFPDWWCADVPHSDSAEYKMWGNGVALPCVLYIMEGIAAALENNEKVTIKKSQQWKQLSFEELETEAIQ